MRSSCCSGTTLFIAGLNQASIKSSVPLLSTVAVVQAQRTRPMLLVTGVAAPIARHNVHASIAVEVASRDAIPPANVFRQPKFFGRFDKVTIVVEKRRELDPTRTRAANRRGHHR
jgi:hypothetical protein